MMATTEGQLQATTDGTQAIRRAAGVLRRIAQADFRGAGLLDVAGALNLSRSTTHRILKCLVDEGLVAYDSTTRRYQLGELASELALSTSSGAVEIARWRQSVDQVARTCGVTAYLMRRSGVEAVCLYRAEGGGVVRVIPVEVGQRRLLGVGAGATALLAALDPEMSEQILMSIAPILHHDALLTVPLIREIVAHARETGFAISRSNVFPEVFGIGRAVRRNEEPVSLAISIAVHSSYVTDSAIEGWKQALLAAGADGPHQIDGQRLSPAKEPVQWDN